MTDRHEPSFTAGDREMLEGWLDYHRATLLLKCEGLDDGALRTRSVPPSSMSLLGLVRHMTEVEHGWFTEALSGVEREAIYCRPDAPDADFDEVDGADVAEAFARFNEAVAVSRAIATERDLDLATPRPDSHLLTLRWVLTHMIEEYARHNGHADLLRERIDGATGD